jgi:FkbM family methyltransferase
MLAAPRVAYYRLRSRGLDPVTRQILETQSYARPMLDFMAAAGSNPRILTDVPLHAYGVAVDLGAYHGDWTAEIIERYSCAVYAFEPNPGLLPALVTRFDKSHEVSVLGYGLGAADRTAILARDGPGSSIHRDRGTFGEVDVTIRDAVRAFEELGLHHIDVMKINIEGAEYDLLERLAETEWLPRVTTLLIQFHEWLPAARRRRRRIRDKLSESHEELWCYPWVWELWRLREPAASE